jgi:hypothetical protein
MQAVAELSAVLKGQRLEFGRSPSHCADVSLKVARTEVWLDVI